jgi:HAMP domain-containing protein
MIAVRADRYTMSPSTSIRGEPIVFCPGVFAASVDISLTATHAESVHAMKLLAKFNLILFVVLFVCMAATTTYAYYVLDRSARHQVLTQARLMMAVVDATRAYTSKEIPEILNDLRTPDRRFHKQEVPAYAARKTFENLQADPIDNSGAKVVLDLTQYTFRQPSDQPTLESDKPTEWEKKYIDLFRDRHSKKEPLGSLEKDRDGEDGVKYLDLAKPVQVEKSCLTCHDKPSNAPPGMIESDDNYTGGFGWKVDSVIGAKIVTVPKTEVEKLRSAMFRTFLGSLILVTLAVFSILNLLLFFSIIRPVSRLTEWACEASTGDLSLEKLPVRGTDEIAILTDSCNRMYNSLISSMNMLRRQKK